MDVNAWIEQYRLAWERGDADLAASLFTEDARYRSLIFDEPHQGHDGIHAYWSRVTSQQSDVEVRMGTPVVQGNRAVVEWWTKMEADGDPLTLPGALILRFAHDGRCEELREYWHHTEGRTDPPAGWGA